MSTINQLKEALELSVVEYKRCKSALSKSVANKSSPRTLKLKIKQLEDSLKDLNACHTSWVSKAKLDADALAAETHSNEWLREIWEEHDTLLDEANNVIENVEESANPSLPTDKQLSLLQKKMVSMRLNIKNELDLLTTNTTIDTLDSSVHSSYSDMLSKLNEKLQSTFGELSSSILTLTNADFETVATDHEDFRQEQQKRVLDLQFKLVKLSKPTVSNTSSSATASGSTRTVEMEKCKAPTFSG